MFWLPQSEAATAWMAAQGYHVVTSGTAEERERWEQWQRTMREYATAISSSEEAPKTFFWMVLALPGGTYADTLEWHPEIPMLIPASGTGKLLGIALNKTDLDDMMERDKNNVHLTFKVRIQGQTAWRQLIEFLATHDMLEHESQ